MAQVAVFGLGRFGYHVVRELHTRGHDVLAVDLDERVVQKVRDFSTQAIAMDARDKDRLEALGLEDFDYAVVSLGEQVEVSTLLTMYLKELPDGPYVITKAGSEDHGKLLEKVGVDRIVFPEQEAAVRLARRLSHRNLMEFIPLGDSHSIEEIAPPETFFGKTLAELDLRNRFRIQVVGIRDVVSDEVRLNPLADTRILSSHSLIVLGENADLERFRKR